MTLRKGQVNLLSVGDFAKICRTTPRTIRFYTNEGLLKPAKIDRWNRYHFYTEEQSRLVFQIKLLQEFGLSLVQIRKLIKSRKAYLSFEEQLEALEKEIQERQQRLEFLSDVNVLLFENKNFKDFVKNEYIGPFELLSMDLPSAEYADISKHIDELRAIADNMGLKVENREITFYHDDEYKPKASHLEISVICKSKPKKQITLPPNVFFRHQPKIKALVFNFRGPYDYLALIYKRFDQMLVENDIWITSPVFEMYTKGPLDTDSPYKYITKIAYPI